MNYFGQISLTKLCDFARKHPEVVKEVTFRDGHTEKMINIDVRERQQPSQYGNIGYISARSADGDKVYVADLKRSKYDSQPQQTAAMSAPVDLEYAKAATQSAPVQEFQDSFAAEVTGSGPIDDLPF